MKTYALIVVVFVFLACQAEGKKHKEPPSATVTCVRGCFHKLIDTLGPINISTVVNLHFGKKNSTEKPHYDSEKDAFEALCGYYDTLESCVTACGEPTDKKDKRRLQPEKHLIHTMNATCKVFKDDLINNWDCIAQLKEAAPTIEECQKCEKSCDVLCLENCVRPTANTVCGSEDAVDVMTKMATYFSLHRVQLMVKISEHEKHQKDLTEEDKACIAQYKEFLKNAESSTTN